MALDAGTAWIAVRPSPQGWSGLKKSLAIAAPLAAIGASALLVGKEFNEMRKSIIVGTGASGKALKDLEASAMKVGKSTPSSFKDVGVAIADVNTRLGLTGKPLEVMSKKFLNLSRVTGTDLTGNIKDATRVFGDWGIAIKDQPKALDKLFFTSQATGIGIDKLAQQVVTFGAPMRQFGFSFEESISLMGKWEKEGVNANAVFAGMKIGLGKLSAAGKDPEKALKQVSAAIKNAGSAGDANRIAIETFGQRAGPDMAAAIREGRFEIGDMVKALDNSGGAIDDADKRTRTFTETWQLLKNRGMALIQPVATRLFDSITKGMNWIAMEGIPALRSMARFVVRNKDAFIALAAGLGAAVLALGIYRAYVKVTIAITKAWTVVQKLLNRSMKLNPIGIVITALGLLVAGLVLAYKKSDTFRKIVDKAWAWIKSAIKAAWERVIKPALKALWTYIDKVLIPIIKWLWDKVVKPVFKALGKFIADTWKNVIKPALNALRDFVMDTLVPAFRKGIGKVKEIWEGLKDAARKPVEFLVNTVYSKGLRPMMNKIPGVNLPEASFATGGWTGPGAKMRPAGVVHADEFVVRKDARRRFEARHPGALDHLNQHGRLPGFFLGGRVPMPSATSIKQHMSGYPWAQWAGDLNGVGDDTGKSVVAWKSGVVAYLKSLTGSYGNHVAINHGNQSSLYAHLNAFRTSPGAKVKAGQQIGDVGTTGNSTGPHLHFEVKGSSVSGESNTDGDGGGFFGVIKAVKSMLGQIKGFMAKFSAFGEWGGIIKQTAVHAAKGARSYINDKIPGPGPIPNIFDSGGRLPTGLSSVYNGTGRTEAVLTTQQWKDIHALARRGMGADQRPIHQHFPTSATPEAAAAAAGGRVVAALSAVGVV